MNLAKGVKELSREDRQGREGRDCFVGQSPPRNDNADNDYDNDYDYEHEHEQEDDTSIRRRQGYGGPTRTINWIPDPVKDRFILR
jgi:hypothetical protein